MSSRGSRIMLWTAPAAADGILTILENHRPLDYTLAPLWHYLGDNLGIIFDTSAQLDITSYDDDVDAAGMTDSTRDILDSFYNPYTAQLYSLIAKNGVSFIDVIEKKVIF